ncbi:MAG: NAD-binding protein [Bacillota bacterium]
MYDQTILIVGWNEKSRYLIKRLTSSSLIPRIFLIDQSLDSSPIFKSTFSFFRGSPLKKETYVSASIDHAHYVILTSNTHQNEEEADKDTIISLLLSKTLYPDAHFIVEILKEEQIKNAYRAGADEVIHSSEFAALTVLDLLFNRKKSINLMELISDSHNKISCHPVPEQAIQSFTYRDLFSQINLNNEETLIAVISKNNRLNFVTNDLVQDGDKLILVEKSRSSHP